MSQDIQKLTASTTSWQSHPLSIIGETRLSLSINGKSLTFEALVVEDLAVVILARRTKIEELMCRAVGDLLQKGCIAIIVESCFSNSLFLSDEGPILETLDYTNPY